MLELPGLAVARPAVVLAEPALPVVAAPLLETPPADDLRTDLRAWLVRIEGRVQPLLILADTIQAAAQRAAREVGVANLAAASISAIERL